MIASAKGRPRVPARTTDCGVPPTATQIGSGRPLDAGARCLIQRRPESAGPGDRISSRSRSSSSSFSANSSS